MLRGWRSSRLAQAVVRVPLVRDLPLDLLQGMLQRLARVHRLGVEYRARAAAWLLTVRIRGVGRLLSLEALHLFFHPEAIMGSRRQRAAALPSSTTDSPADRQLAPLVSDSGGPKLRACVYASSAGNFFHSELAELIALGLEASGCFEVQRRDESSEPGEADLPLVVAPHEFFRLGAGARFSRPSYRAFRRRCSLFLAEQPGTTHFVACLPFAAEARFVLDLNAQSAAALRRLGLDAHFFPVGHVNSPEAVPEPLLPEGGSLRGLSLAAAVDEGSDPRPIDVLFTGVLTRRRAAFFSRHAGFFAARRCVLSLPTPLTPLGTGVVSTLVGDEATALSRRSKIVLNVHRDRRAYFEWHRVVIRGFWHGALVVSEPSTLPPGLVAGEHLLEAPLDEIPELIRWLLDEPDGRRKADDVRNAGHRLLVEQYDMRCWARGLARLLREDVEGNRQARLRSSGSDPRRRRA